MRRSQGWTSQRGVAPQPGVDKPARCRAAARGGQASAVSRRSQGWTSQRGVAPQPGVDKPARGRAAARGGQASAVSRRSQGWTSQRGVAPQPGVDKPARGRAAARGGQASTGSRLRLRRDSRSWTFGSSGSACFEVGSSLSWRRWSSEGQVHKAGAKSSV